jgi:WD40 repeat protein
VLALVLALGSAFARAVAREADAGPAPTPPAARSVKGDELAAPAPPGRGDAKATARHEARADAAPTRRHTAPPEEAAGPLPYGLPESLRALSTARRMRLGGAWGGYALRAHASAMAIAARRAITADPSGVRIWDLESGRQLRLLPGAQGDVEVVTLTPDGHLVATGGRDGTVALWDTESGRARGLVRRPGAPVSAVAFSHDGRALAWGSADGAVRVWDLGRGRGAQVLSGHKDLVRALAFQPNGQGLVTASDDGTLRIWDLARGRPLRVLGEPGGPELTALSLSPGGRRALVAEEGRGLRLWSLEEGKSLRLFREVPGAMALAFAPDGLRAFAARSTRRQGYAVGAAAGAGLPQLEIWTLGLSSEEPAKSFSRRDTGLDAAAFSPDAAQLFMSEGGGLRLFEVEKAREQRATAGHTGAVKWIAVSPDGAKAITAAADHTARLWAVATGQELFVFGGYGEQVQGAAFSPDGKLALVGDLAGSQKLWDLATGETLRQLGAHRGLESLAFVRDGVATLSASCDRVAVWDAASGRELSSLWFSKLVERVAFSPDGRLALTSGSTDGPQLFDLATSKLLQTFARPGRIARAVALSADGRVAAIATAPAELGANADLVELWDVGGGLVPQTLRASPGVEALAWSPDGKLLLSAGRFGEVSLYAPASRREVGRLELGVNGERPTAVTFAPDGSSLMIGTSLGGVLRFLLSEEPRRH